MGQYGLRPLDDLFPVGIPPNGAKPGSFRRTWSETVNYADFSFVIGQTPNPPSMHSFWCSRSLDRAAVPRGWSGAKLSMLRSPNTRVAHLPEVVASAPPLGGLDQISIVRFDAIEWAGWGDEATDQMNLRRT